MFRWVFVLLLLFQPAIAGSDDAGLVTRPSAHSVRETLDRFAQAVRAQGWVVFTEIDHAAAGQAVGQTMPARSVLFFGDPATGTPAMRAHPTLALDLPMRVLVWQDGAGAVFITRSTGADVGARVFARHGLNLPPDAARANEAMLDALARKAAE